MAIDLILGTAGHIDHGKTSLIRALTGTDTDRLPEEKKRGITIELGYAELIVDPYHFGIVDVPGHEKFVRQMVSGATGMDVVMLIIAADDSIKQQTREHLEILRLLDIPAGIIALTKCDLVEPDWLELVEDEIRQFVSATFLELAPIVRTSSHTMAGIDELKKEIVVAAGKASKTNQQQTQSVPFRLAIDRCFALQGHGTVVTGSVNSGQVKVGDSINVEPGGVSVRVRSLHNHAASVEEVHRGQRAAINIGGIHHEEVKRGQELCAPGYLIPSSICTVELLLLPGVRKLKNRAKLRFHVGTAEILGHIRLLNHAVAELGFLNAGQKCFAQVYLSEPCVCVWGQPFVARSESPVGTIGGGRIIDPNALAITKPNEMDLQKVQMLASVSSRDRVDANAYFGSIGNWRPQDLPRTTGVYEYKPVIDSLISDDTLEHIEISPTNSLLIHRASIGVLARNIENTIAKQHAAHPLRWSFPTQEISKRFMYLAHSKLFDVALKQLIQEKKVRRDHGMIGLEGFGPKLTKYEQQLLTEMTKTLKDAGVAPPGLKKLVQSAQRNKERVPELLELGCSNGQLVKIDSDIFFHQETMDAVKLMLVEKLAVGGLSMSDIRQVIGTSRKFAVPLCEYLDDIGFTRRDGDLRVLGKIETVTSSQAD